MQVFADFFDVSYQVFAGELGLALLAQLEQLLVLFFCAVQRPTTAHLDAGEAVAGL
jgi:hypothetical protein